MKAEGHECYHCKQWIEAGEPHDCWTTTETALTRDLSDDLQEAWERLRETAAGFGDQRIYASHSSIMFSRRSCYLFVRPKRTCLEVCIFLGRTIKAPQIRRVEPASQVKKAHFLRITHRDEVEPPITDWMREAYDLQDGLTTPGRRARTPKMRSKKTSSAQPGKKTPRARRRDDDAG